MKKTILTLSLLTLSSLLASDTFKTDIALTGGFNKFDSASKMDNTSLFGIRATVYENEVNMYGLQVGYEGATGIDYAHLNKKTDLHRIFTHMVVDGEAEYDVTPYLFLGGGYEYLSDEIKGEPSQGFIDLGLGFKYFFNKNVNLLLETRAVGKFDTRDLDLTTNIGVGYMFGEKNTRKVEPIIALEKKEEVLEKIVPQETISIVNAPIVKSTVNTYQYPEEMTAMKIDKGERVIPYEEASPIVTSYEVSSDEEIVVSSAYYVQMAAYRKTSTQALLHRLSERGYDNSLEYAKENLTSVLVGPFSDKKEAVTALKSLRNIKRDAFLFQMK